MSPERWREVEQVYQSAMDREPQLRAAYLAETCGDDRELRREVDSLLELNHSPALVDEPAWQAVAGLLTDGTQIAPGTLLGPYRIEAMLGAGGMGQVYQAQDTRLGRTVAVKVSRVEFNARFEREARAVAALNHPNVCTIHDVGPNYLVMELVEGPTLSDRLKEGPIPLEEVLRLARQIADALEAAHEKGIVHRDLKPGNIKIKPDGTVKVLDFGLAKLRPVDPAPGTRPEDSPTISMAATSAGMILGTAAYMSPEQARGKAVDKRADIWAFGVVLYEMVTGRRLFEGEDVTETLALVIRDEPKWDGIPANLQRLLKSCLHKDPKRRLRDIGDAWQVLEAASNAAVARRSRLGTIALAAAATLGLALSALAFVHFREKPPALEAVRVQISPPAHTSFYGNYALLSPDGRRLAFLARGSDGRYQLWVRSLDSIDSRPLAGTEGVGNACFWSPDSRFLAFSMRGMLNKIDVSSGKVQRVCDIPSAVGPFGTWRGGAWSPQGVIIFGADGTGVWRVPEAGGVPSEVTRIDPSRRESFHAGPDFLPDGRHFLYHRVAPGLGDNGIYLGSLDTRPEQQSSKRLLASDSSAAYAASSDSITSNGHILFLRSGSLMAQAFDVRRLALAGDAVPIDEVISGGSRHFSASMTGALAYQPASSAGSGETKNQLTWFNREGKVLGPAGEPGAYQSLALSPDGSRVAVSRINTQFSRRFGGWKPFDIWVHDFARNASERLTSNPASDWLPTWSPDGNRIIFSSEREPDPFAFNLYQRFSSGAGSDELLYKSNQDKSVQDWSRDGRFLLYSVAVRYRTLTNTSSHDLWVLPLSPGNPEDREPQPYLQTEANESQGKFSPNGRFIAYRSDASGSDEIYVQPFPIDSSRKWKVSTAGATSPRWSGDGKELFYISPDSKMMAVEVSTNPVFKFRTPKVLFPAITSESPNVTPYDVTADGKKFLMITMAEGGAPGTVPIMVVLNWTALLKK